MQAAVPVSNFYSALAVLVLFLHALFVLWVVFGALLTRSRPMLLWLHIGSLVWGILTEVLLWPCPLTLLENWLERNAGVEPDQGGVPAPLLGQAGLPGYFFNHANDCGRNHLRSESCILWLANLDGSISWARQTTRLEFDLRSQ
jgi:hypothetical protein